MAIRNLLSLLFTLLFATAFLSPGHASYAMTNSPCVAEKAPKERLSVPYAREPIRVRAGTHSVLPPTIWSP